MGSICDIRGTILKPKYSAKSTKRFAWPVLPESQAPKGVEGKGDGGGGGGGGEKERDACY